MKIPSFYIFGDKPVKFVKTHDNGMDIQAFDWDKKDFVRDMSYLSRWWNGDNMEEVAEEEFNAYVEKLKNGEI